MAGKRVSEVVAGSRASGSWCARSCWSGSVERANLWLGLMLKRLVWNRAQHPPCAFQLLRDTCTMEMALPANMRGIDTSIGALSAQVSPSLRKFHHQEIRLVLVVPGRRTKGFRSQRLVTSDKSISASVVVSWGKGSGIGNEGYCLCWICISA